MDNPAQLLVSTSGALLTLERWRVSGRLHHCQGYSWNVGWSNGRVVGGSSASSLKLSTCELSWLGWTSVDSACL
jgi:hypothetical protein